MPNTSLSPVLQQTKTLRTWMQRLLQPFSRPLITEAEKKQFDEEGYLVIDPQVPDSLLEQIKAEVEPLHSPRTCRHGRVPAHSSCPGCMEDL